MYDNVIELRNAGMQQQAYVTPSVFKVFVLDVYYNNVIPSGLFQNLKARLTGRAGLTLL
jgi:hypothetical protein